MSRTYEWQTYEVLEEDNAPKSNLENKLNELDTAGWEVFAVVFEPARYERGAHYKIVCRKKL